MRTGATFSDCRKYRYCLWRIWDEKKPRIMFIGLNPSTADEKQNDATIRRVISFAQSWGYGGVYMLNLYSFCTKSPKVLFKEKDPLKDNNKWLRHYRKKSIDVLFAWGSFNVFPRDMQVYNMFPGSFCIGYNKDDTPKHPLFAKSDLKKIPYLIHYEKETGNRIRVPD